MIRLDEAVFDPSADMKSACASFKLSGENLAAFRRLANETDDDGEFKKFLEIVLDAYAERLNNKGSHGNA